MATTKLEKEALALKLRQQALLHLQKEGQAVEKIPLTGVIAPKKDAGKGGDNTLDLLIKQKATAQIKNAAKVTPTVVKSDVPPVAVTSTPSSLPPNWQEVPDASTGRSYYWNTATNATTWERPIISVTSSSVPTTASISLPDGWVEKVHPATRQKYYSHPATGRTSVTVPVEAISQKLDASSEVGKRQREAIESTEQRAKR